MSLRTCRLILLGSLLLLLYFAAPFDFFYTVKAAPDIHARVADAETGDAARQFCVSVMLLGAVWIAWRRRKSIRSYRSISGILLSIFVCWASLSLAWSEDPALTARKLIVLWAVVLTALALSLTVDLSGLMILGAVGCGAFAAISFIAEVTLGTFRPFDSDYLFSGIMHPNQQGMNLVVYVICVLGLWKARYIPTWLTLTLGCPGITLLLLTRSRTAVGSGLFAAAMLVLIGSKPRRRLVGTLLIGLAVCVAGIGFIATQTSESLASILLMGRDQEEAGSLTNRIPLWSECSEYLERKPVLGYGYDSFWTPDRVYSISDHQGWAIGEMHNTYLETLIDLGPAGTILYVGIFLSAIASFRTVYKRTQNPQFLWMGSLCVWLCLNMSLESIFPQPSLPILLCLSVVLSDIKNNFKMSIYNDHLRG